MHLEFGLAGKTVVVTGGAGAIGRAVCEGFAEAGARVAVVDIDPEMSNEVASALGEGHRGWGADLTETNALGSLVESISETMGEIDVLVNTAAVIVRNNDLLAVSESDWDRQHDTNLKALFFLSQAVARRLIGANRPGAFVNYSSQGWISGGFDGSVVYNATKGAVTTMTRGMARSWADHRIRVNAVAPGLVDTPMLTDDLSADQIEGLRNSIPMKRLGQPADHVGATVFLASDLAGYMTGATVNVSGGFLMY